MGRICSRECDSSALVFVSGENMENTNLLAVIVEEYISSFNNRNASSVIFVESNRVLCMIVIDALYENDKAMRLMNRERRRKKCVSFRSRNRPLHDSIYTNRIARLRGAVKTAKAMRKVAGRNKAKEAASRKRQSRAA